MTSAHAKCATVSAAPPAKEPIHGVRGRALPQLAASADLTLRQLVRLRWLALAAQGAAVLAVGLVWRVELPLLSLLGILSVGAVTNWLLPMQERNGAQRAFSEVLLLDVVLLTAVLALTGGPANPFSVLYLVQVMLAAMVSTPAWTWSVVALSSVGFGLLFFVGVPLPPELGGHGMHAGHDMGAGDGQPYSAHLQGMWLAYTVVAAVIATFVSKLAEALRQERETRGRASQLLGLATLAAGAAHEIGNPLGTIAVAASELEQELSSGGASAETLADLRLIGREVTRARDVLKRMSVGAGELVGESPIATDLASLIQRAASQVDAARIEVDVARLPAGQTVQWPVEATMQALGQLLRNALDASPADTLVQCGVRLQGDSVEIRLQDHGRGMTEEVLHRIGEPFFTTRPEGTGLGVFIARSLIEHLGGRLLIDSRVGEGTRATVLLPLGFS